MHIPTKTTLRLKEEYENAEHEVVKMEEDFGSFPTPSEEDKLNAAKSRLEVKKAEYLDALGQLPKLNKEERVVREPGITIQSNPWIRFSPTLPPQPPVNTTVLIAGYFKSNSNKIYYYTAEYTGTKWNINTSFLNQINAVFIVTHWQTINTNLT